MYALRPGGAGSPCRTFRVLLRRTPEGLVEVRTAYVGRRTPPEPHSPTAQADAALLAESLAFWKDHALVWDGVVDESYGVHDVAPPEWTHGAPSEPAG